MTTKEKINILMVDDQPAKLLSYEVMLGELNENLIQATSGKVALELLLKNDVAVVLMDVSMPELDGFELATMIRQHPRFQKTAIIFISAVHLTDIDRLKGYKHGAVDYISVPVIPELLRAKVSIFAELHRKTRQLETLNQELERRVTERTEELESKALALLVLNRELANKHQELNAIVRTAPDIIFSKQQDGARDYISDRFYEFTGADPEKAMGLGWWDYVHPDDRERSLQGWMDSNHSKTNYEAEYRMRGKDGEYRWFRSRAVPIRDDEGNVIKWYGTCSDIHDSKLLEQSIRDNAAELEKMVDDRTAALRRLSVRLMTMQDEERRRIARDLHDGLGQDGSAEDGRGGQASIPRSQRHYRSRDSAGAQPVSPSASTVARRSGFDLGAALVPRGSDRTQRDRNLFRCSAKRFSTTGIRCRNCDLPYCSRGAHQRLPPCRGAQCVDWADAKRGCNRYFGA
jgi:PAS domain S-box-containing protein